MPVIFILADTASTDWTEPLRVRFVDSALWQTMRAAGDATTPLMLANLGAGMALHMKPNVAQSTTSVQHERRLSRNLVAAVSEQLMFQPCSNLAAIDQFSLLTAIVDD